MKQSIGSDALKLTMSKIIAIMISMISAMLLSRFLTLKEFGTYSQLLLVVNLMTTVFMLGLPDSINFFLARAENIEGKQKFLSVYYTLSSILGFVTGLVLIISTPLIINYFDNLFIKNFIFVLAILPWANVILSSIDNVLINYDKTKNLLLFRLLNSVSLLLIILIVEILNIGFTAYMLLFISVELIFVVSVYIIVRNISGYIKLSFDRGMIKKIFSFSIPIGFASVIGMLSVQLDKLIIGKFYSTEEIAIYSNAAREMPVTIIGVSLTAVLMPRLVRLLKENKKENAIRLWCDTITLSYSFICFFSFGLFVFASEVISLLYSEKYLPGVTVFRIYSLVLLLRFTYFGMILNSIGKTKFIFYSSLVSLVLNFVLSYLFYLYFGFIGPAIATFMSIFLVAFFQIIATARGIQFPLKRIFPWGDLLKITLINILLAIIFVYLKKLLSLERIGGEITESIILGTIWMGLYYLLMVKKIKLKWHNINGN